MDALLLEKAETQQSLSFCRKELDKTKQQSRVSKQHYVFQSYTINVLL